MNPRHLRKARLQILATVALAFLLTSGAALAQPVPFACTGEAFIVQDRTQGKLFTIDQSVTPFDLVPLGDANNNSICDPGEACNLDISSTPIEANNLGFRENDGLLYAMNVDLTAGTNSGIIQIDSNGDVFPVATPAGVPTNVAFNAGDVSTDGSIMYINLSGRGTVYRVDLTPLDSAMNPTLAGTATIAAGFATVANVVLDWAYHPAFPPASALLFGADRTGQIARLDPNTGTRQDFTVAGLPGNGLNRDVDYGGAWFNAAGELFVFDNGDPDAMPPRDGRIFKITITNPTANPPTFSVSQIATGENSIANDAAACVQDIIGAAKQMTVSSATCPPLPTTLTIDYNFENFSGSQTLTLVSVIDDLVAVFGATPGNWTFGSISSTGIAHNPGFNGSTDTQLIDQSGGGQNIGPGATASVTVTINLLNNSAGNGGEFCNQVQITGFVGATQFGDLSTSGTDPDPDGNGVPDERALSCVTCVPVELMTFDIE